MDKLGRLYEMRAVTSQARASVSFQAEKLLSKEQQRAMRMELSVAESALTDLLTTIEAHIQTALKEKSNG